MSARVGFAAEDAIEATTKIVVPKARQVLPHWAWVAADITASTVSHETACGVAVLVGTRSRSAVDQNHPSEGCSLQYAESIQEGLTGQSSAAHELPVTV